MKEKQRQQWLREMGYRPGSSPASIWLQVYVPEAVQVAHPATRPGDYGIDARTPGSVTLLGATNIRVVGQGMVADWPQHYWSA